MNEYLLRSDNDWLLFHCFACRIENLDCARYNKLIDWETVERHEPWTNHVHMWFYFCFVFFFFLRFIYVFVMFCVWNAQTEQTKWNKKRANQETHTQRERDVTKENKNNSNKQCKMHFCRSKWKLSFITIANLDFTILFPVIMFHAAVIVFFPLYLVRSLSVFCHSSAFFSTVFAFVSCSVSFVECVYVSVIAITLLAFHRYVAFGTLILNHKKKRKGEAQKKKTERHTQRHDRDREKRRIQVK